MYLYIYLYIYVCIYLNAESLFLSDWIFLESLESLESCLKKHGVDSWSA